MLIYPNKDWHLAPLPEQGRHFCKRIDITELEAMLRTHSRHGLTYKFYNPVINPDSKRLILHTIPPETVHGLQIGRKYDAWTKTLTLVIDCSCRPSTQYLEDRVIIPLQGVKKVRAEVCALEPGKRVQDYAELLR